MPEEYVFATYIGMMVGWLFITYGVVLWAYGDHPLIVVRDREAGGVAYPFAFVTVGVGFLLMANETVKLDPLGNAAVEALGYLLVAMIGTAIFVFRVLYLRYRDD